MTKKTCYICSAPATSKEHAPAQCFFPEEAAYRKNLITVPSCALHNEDTSPDDEYVRNLIVMSLGTNHIAFRQFTDKTLKLLKKSPKLLNELAGVKKRVLVDGKPTWAFQRDRARFDRAIIKIARALFYHEGGQPWNEDLFVGTKNILTGDMQMDDLGAFFSEVEPMVSEDDVAGNNPEVFRYSFHRSSSANSQKQVLKMTFYEGFIVWVVPREG